MFGRNNVDDYDDYKREQTQIKREKDSHKLPKINKKINDLHSLGQLIEKTGSAGCSTGRTRRELMSPPLSRVYTISLQGWMKMNIETVL